MIKKRKVKTLCEDCSLKPPRKNGYVCWSCTIERYKAKHPIKYTYFVLRQNARRRKKEFTISFEYFKKLVMESGYMEGRGKTAHSLTIDRDKNWLGYIEGNLKIITNRENGIKADKEINHEGIYTMAEVTF